MEYKEECGCKLKQLGHVITAIEYCPLHKSAPDLYEACKSVVEYRDELSYGNPVALNLVLRRVNQAIAKVEGK